MLIQVLYIPGCCNHSRAVERVRRVMSSQDSNFPILEVPVNDDSTARTLQFPGSPTVRINGMDAEPGSQARFAFACRLYPDGSGIPSEAALQHAISAAKHREQGHGKNHTIG
jgi:hypothetical protein